MNAEQKQRAIKLITYWRNRSITTMPEEYFVSGDCMTDLLQELIDAPEPEPVSDGHVYVHVSGLTGSGKSAVAGEIEIAMRAIGLDVEWVDSKSEKRLTHADYTSALELYRPKVRIFEKNIPRTAPPAPSVPDEQLQAAFDRGLKAGNKQSVAQQIEIHKLHDSLATRQQEQPEQPADNDAYHNLRQDAELLDALEDEVKSRGLFGVSLDYTSHAEDGLIVEKGYRVLMRKFLGPRKTTLRDAISAAFDPIERDKKGQS